ncbi:response regulator transcription factor [Streptomyces sedi]
MAGDAADIGKAIDSIGQLQPDLVVLDATTDSLDTAGIRRLTTNGSGKPPPVLVLVDQVDERVYRLPQFGVRGLLLNQSSPEQIVSAVRLVAAGYALFLPHGMPADHGPPVMGEEPTVGVCLGHLTRRESDVLQLIARGLSNAEISAALFVSESTVKSHVQRMLDKLDLRNRVHAVIYAYEIGMVRVGVPVLATAGA